MRAAVSALWSVLMLCTGLAAVGFVVRMALYRRHERLVQAWADTRQKNEALCGHPGPVELEEFPGVAESWRDIGAFGRVWMALMGVTCVCGLLLSIVLGMG